ncbi:septum site-determining protein Ssd [Nocardioides marmorisolisilvae]|uniref:Septum site determining protein n=1 Tax=Nocardioides marmorisolisilvae TaxID=1542737 RepID=A0A3N0E0Y0_9ACTN|nr:septum site-determining protein Ssd [Nocardioides marmorisolisilvae]RNL81495.1 septum site determining protein [Nocardioides marmorisolisilvae]
MNVHVPPPLLVTDDDALISEVLRLAAAAGVVPEVVADEGAALQLWPTAPLVLVGADRADRMARAQPARRPGVHVLGVGSLPDLLFRDALACSAESVAALPASDSWLIELLADAADGSASRGTVFGVIGGAGGVGATVFAAALGQVLGARGGALLIDADVGGAGLDRVLGMEKASGVRWDSLVQATGRLSARSLRDAVPGRDGLSVLTWPVHRAPGLPAFAVREALSAGTRGFRSVVVDLPRHPDPVTDEVLARCDHVILVTTTTVPAVTAAARVARRLPASTSKVLLRDRTGGVNEFDIARLLRLPVLASMGDQRGLDEAISLGAGPLRFRRGALARAAKEVATSLGPQAAERVA